MNFKTLNFHYLLYSGYILYLKYYLQFTKIREDRLY